MKRYRDIIFALLMFTILWQIVSAVIARPFLPGPALVAITIARLAFDGRLWPHVAASLSRIFWALIISSALAVILGLAAGRSERINRLVSPVIYFFHPLPKAAFLPVIMLFFGIGEASKIFLVGFIIFSQMLVNVRDAAKLVPGEYVDSVRSLGAGKIDILYHVIIPAALPGFFTGFRVSLGTAMAVLFIAETFASQSGLGYIIVDAWTRISYAEMYAAIVVLSLLGLLLFILTDLLERVLCKWH